MRIYIDESGDTGLKLDQGSSPFFVLSLVLFERVDEAEKCATAIEELKKTLNLSARTEFHFNHNTDKTRRAFLETVDQFEFSCFSVVINKSSRNLRGKVFESKETFFKYACDLVFTKAMPFINNAVVTFDRAGTKEFRNEIRLFLNAKNDKSTKLVRKYKQTDSQKESLLQLADYVAGIYNRKFQGKKGWQEYYELIARKEMSLEVYPEN